MKRFLLIALLFVVLVGCDRPHHTVIDSSDMVVYAVKVREHNKELGMYECWITDRSTKGWSFITNQPFKVGDKIKVDIK